MTTLRASDERRREIALGRLRQLLPRLYFIVRDELAYREAVGDLVPGALVAGDVVDAVVLAAYRELVDDPDAIGVPDRIRRVALGHIDREVTRLRGNGAQRIQVEQDILYFFEPDEDLDGEDVVSQPVPAPAPMPVQQPEADELRPCLERVLKAMPPVWRRALLLRHVDGLTGPAVARAVGRPEREIGALLDHARAYLREYLLSSRCAATELDS
jgi:hypothetical protein